LFNAGESVLVILGTLFFDLKQVRDESDCVDCGVCVGGFHYPGTGEYRGAEFWGAVRLPGQPTAFGLRAVQPGRQKMLVVLTAVKNTPS